MSFRMTGWLSEFREDEAEEWGKVMLSHSFDEKEWKNARTRLQELLKEDGKQAEEGSMRSYLSCCAESVAGSHPVPSLQSLVEELYEEYGMENSKDLIK